MSRNSLPVSSLLIHCVTSREGRVSRNFATPSFPNVYVIVTSREGRVSRNSEGRTASFAVDVTSREGRVSRNKRKN